MSAVKQRWAMMQ